MQEIALAGLYRGGFFEEATFYGGTALRVFYQLDRFSEDMDFSLLKPNDNFSLTPYFTAIKKLSVELASPILFNTSIMSFSAKSNNHCILLFFFQENLLKYLNSTI